MAFRKSIPRPLDMRSLGEALSHPGIDPRIWVSLATVDDEEVVWDQDLGALIPITSAIPGKSERRWNRLLTRAKRKNDA